MGGVRHAPQPERAGPVSHLAMWVCSCDFAAAEVHPIRNGIKICALDSSFSRPVWSRPSWLWLCGPAPSRAELNRPVRTYPVPEFMCDIGGERRSGSTGRPDAELSHDVRACRTAIPQLLAEHGGRWNSVRPSRRGVPPRLRAQSGERLHRRNRSESRAGGEYFPRIQPVERCRRTAEYDAAAGPFHEKRQRLADIES